MSNGKSDPPQKKTGNETENGLEKALASALTLRELDEPRRLDIEVPEGTDEQWFQEYLNTRRSAICDNRITITKDGRVINPLLRKPPNNDATDTANNISTENSTE